MSTTVIDTVVGHSHTHVYVTIFIMTVHAAGRLVFLRINNLLHTFVTKCINSLRKSRKVHTEVKMYYGTVNTVSLSFLHYSL